MNSMVRIVIGVVVGGMLGFGYYRLIGCSTGACPLTSNPWLSTLYGMLLGGLFGSSFH
ncbi:YtxH domain-containing protein [bacterium]|nr:YtxH domain-containing protein [bacterium]